MDLSFHANSFVDDQLNIKYTQNTLTLIINRKEKILDNKLNNVVMQLTIVLRLYSEEATAGNPTSYFAPNNNLKRSLSSKFRL